MNEMGEGSHPRTFCPPILVLLLVGGTYLLSPLCFSIFAVVTFPKTDLT